jgi:hypothetical protein
MAGSLPYSQVVGPCTFYIAPVGTAEPAVNATPSGAWVELGATDGEQSIELQGEMTFFRDNDHQGEVKAVRPEEAVLVTFTLVNSTHEMLARVLSTVANVTADAGPPAVSRLPFRRGFLPTEYALLMKGEADSPYGNYPGQNYFPRGVIDSSPTLTRARDARQEVECTYHVLEDDTQTAGNTMGWSTVQTG